MRRRSPNSSNELSYTLLRKHKENRSLKLLQVILHIHSKRLNKFYFRE